MLWPNDRQHKYPRFNHRLPIAQTYSREIVSPANNDTKDTHNNVNLQPIAACIRHAKTFLSLSTRHPQYILEAKYQKYDGGDGLIEYPALAPLFSSEKLILSQWS